MYDLNLGYEITNKRPLLPSAFGEEKHFATLELADGSAVETVIKDVSRLCPDYVKRHDRGVVPSIWYQSIWKRYVDAGIDTHEWMEVIDENNIIMPNLYAKDLRMYGRNFYKSMNWIYGRSRPEPLEMDRFAVPLSGRDLFAATIRKEQIEAVAITHVERASKAGIILPFDDPYEFLVYIEERIGIGTYDLSHTAFGRLEDSVKVNMDRMERANMIFSHSQKMITELDKTRPELFEH